MSPYHLHKKNVFLSSLVEIKEKQDIHIENIKEAEREREREKDKYIYI